MGDGEDRDAIVDVLLRYAWGIDSKDWELFRSCFTPDCTVTYGGGSNSPHPGGVARFDNADELVDYIARTHQPLDGCLHRMSNIVVDVTAPDRATARTYGNNVLVLQSHPDGPVYESVGYYTDELVKTEGGWRIATRTYTRVWGEGNGKVVQPDG